MLDVERWPDLREPALVMVLTGWVDAGAAGATAGAMLAAQLTSGRVFGRLDLSDLVDLQQTRPTVSLVDGATREIAWPAIEFTAGRSGRDVVLCAGPEPSLRWPSITSEIVEAARRLGVRHAFSLGAMPAVVSHRRPTPVLATATSAALADEAGGLRTDYEGPTGLQTVVQVALGDAGIPTVGLWAQVPHYVSGNPSPPATRALLVRLRELAGVEIDVSMLDDECESYVDKVEEGLADRPDVAELVEAIESEQADLPTGDELASEIERFLREQ